MAPIPMPVMGYASAVLDDKIFIICARAIYIKSDGSVEGTDKISRDGDVYTFLENISIDVSGVDGISVNMDNIVIDRAGYCLEHLEKIITIFQEIIGI